jgi:glycerol-3-phosphate acyltransferase PlsY
MNLALAAAAAYLLGGVPFAALAARAKGVDLRTHGSGNLGATNAIRILGPAVGIPVLLADVAKGWFCASMIPRLFGSASIEAGIVCAAAAVVGHVFPIALSFRGGKGVATAAGALFALAPRSITLACVAFVVVLLVSRFVSLASIAASLTLAISLWASPSPRVLQLAGSAIAALVIGRHRANVARLLTGTEPRVRIGRIGRGAA